MKFIHIYALSLPTVAAIMGAALLLWALACVIAFRGGKKAQLAWRSVNAVLLCFSILAILYYTLIRRSAGTTHAVPFIRTIADIRAQPELIREMVMNVFLFFPLGLTMPYALGRRPLRPALITVVTALLLSCAIELTQYLFTFGSAELSDILCNTLGAGIGAVSYRITGGRGKG